MNSHTFNTQELSPLPLMKKMVDLDITPSPLKRRLFAAKSLIPLPILKIPKKSILPSKLNDFYNSKEFQNLQEIKGIHSMADGDLREMFSFKKYASDF